MRTSLIARSAAALAGLALALTACGGGGDPLSSGSGQTSGAAAPNDTVVVGSANFVESQILAEIYAQALSAKGVTVEKRLNIGSREAYIPASAGRVDRPHPGVQRGAAAVLRQGRRRDRRRTRSTPRCRTRCRTT